VFLPCYRGTELQLSSAWQKQPAIDSLELLKVKDGKKKGKKKRENKKQDNKRKDNHSMKSEIYGSLVFAQRTVNIRALLYGRVPLP